MERMWRSTCPFWLHFARSHILFLKEKLGSIMYRQFFFFATAVSLKCRLKGTFGDRAKSVGTFREVALYDPQQARSWINFGFWVGIADGFHHVKKSIDVRSIQNIWSSTSACTALKRQPHHQKMCLSCSLTHFGACRQSEDGNRTRLENVWHVFVVLLRLPLSVWHRVSHT